MEVKYIEFFIDTYRKEAFSYVMEMVDRINDPKEIRGNHTTVYDVAVKNIHVESDDVKYLTLRGTWDAYRVFLRGDEKRGNLDLPENYRYHYSLSHYEED